MCEICGVYENSNTSSTDISVGTTSLGGDVITSHTVSGNAVVKFIEGTVKWSDNTIDVAFGNTTIKGITNPTFGGVGGVNINDFSTNVKNGVLEALSLIEEVCGLNFNILTDGDVNADIMLWESSDVAGFLGYSDFEGGAGLTNFGLPGDTYNDVYVWSDVTNYETNFSSNNGKGSKAFYTWIHEICHSLGLGHPHDTGFGSEDMGEPFDGYGGYNYGIHTVMSYNGYADDYPFVPGLQQGDSYTSTGSAVLGAYDIYALQQMYGTNSSHNSGDTTYTLSDYSWGYQSIWDAGGTDTISHAGESTSAVINLTAATLSADAYSGGGWSYTSDKTFGISVANNVVIENATGGSGNDTLIGNAANNTLDGGAGNDTMLGGTGDDIYYVDSASDVVTESSGEGTDTIRSSVSFTASSNVENLTLTGSSDIDATGNSENNTLTGNSGNNTLDGGSGNDTMVGGSGDDTYVVDSTSDVVTESSGQGTDTVKSSSISLSLANYANVENLTLTGSSGLNLAGNASANTLTGNSGNNTIDGGAGNDTMIGGAGDDIYIVDSSSDVVTESSGQGTDTVKSSSISLSLANYAHVENLTLTGSSNLDLTGNDSGNTLTCNSGDNIIDGNGGTDYVVFSDTKANVITSFGFHHSDNSIIIEGSYGTDVIQDCEYITFSDQTISVSDLKNQYDPAAGGSGGQKMFTNATSGEAPYVLASTYTGPVGWIDWEYIANDDGSVNVITGSDDDDFINVKNGTDAVDAGAGDDIIDGGLGSNFLTGGAGTDRFYIDGRVIGTTWSTVTDWDNTERLAIWGWQQGVSTREWVENLGAEGYKGATLRCDLDGDGTLDLRVTFTGYTSDQIKEPTEFPASDLLWFV